jgi:hypothetical protein
MMIFRIIVHMVFYLLGDYGLKILGHKILCPYGWDGVQGFWVQDIEPLQMGWGSRFLGTKFCAPTIYRVKSKR